MVIIIHFHHLEHLPMFSVVTTIIVIERSEKSISIRAQPSRSPTATSTVSYVQHQHQKHNRHFYDNRHRHHHHLYQHNQRQPELQKRANRADQSVLFFLASANFWEKHAKNRRNHAKTRENRQKTGAFFGANFFGGEIGRC